ncbi:hypothetical protein ACFW04_012008 [Cataglyphis niger]
MVSLKCPIKISRSYDLSKNCMLRREEIFLEYIVQRYDDLWQANVVKMRPYSRFNRGHHYILTVIDVLSKYALAISLKSKGRSKTANAIAEIIRDSKRCPRNIQTDMGKEFYNTDVQCLMRKHDINHYSMYSVLKASVVERFNRTLKNNMWKMFTLNGTNGWMSCRDSCQITTRTSIERSLCDPSTLPRSPKDSWLRCTAR